MKLLLVGEIREGISPPPFGGDFAPHLAQKKNPAVRQASITAWTLLATGLLQLAGRVSADVVHRGDTKPNPGETEDESSELVSPVAFHFCESQLPAVSFGAQGKPMFAHLPLHFSLAHSSRLAVALLSDKPCGVDVEMIRPDVAERLRERCLSPEELHNNPDFFECWTKKECIGKQSGAGICSHPAKINTLDARLAECFFTARLRDTAGQNYALAALCEGAKDLIPQFIRV